MCRRFDSIPDHKHTREWNEVKSKNLSGHFARAQASSCADIAMSTQEKLQQGSGTATRGSWKQVSADEVGDLAISASTDMAVDTAE